MLEVVHQRLELGAVVLGVVLPVERRRARRPARSSASRTRAARCVGDLRAGRHVLLVAVGRLGRHLVARRRRCADRGQVDVLELAQVPPVLHRAVRRGGDDQQRDQRADAHDGVAAALLGALLLLADLVDDRLAVGLARLLGHGYGAPRVVDCTGGCAGQEKGSREPDGGVYGVTGRITAFSGPSSGRLDPAVRERERRQPGVRWATARPPSTGSARDPEDPRHGGRHLLGPGGRAERHPVGRRRRPARGPPPRGRRTRTGPRPRPGPAPRRPDRRRPAAAPGRPGPRTSANGRPASLPWASSAAPASSSASAGAVTASSLP